VARPRSFCCRLESPAVDLAAGERLTGPVLVSCSGRRLDWHGAARIVCRVARRAGIAKRIAPHSLRQGFITTALDAGVPLQDVQIAARHADPSTTTRYNRACHHLDRHASYIVTAFVTGAA
jgi:integrase/recombinase XerD